MPYTIEEIREKAAPVAMRYGVDSMSLFGSYARGEADEKSDLDFYIEKGKLRTLFEHSGLIMDLEAIFGRHVDVVILSGIRNKNFYNEITREGIKLYERK